MSEDVETVRVTKAGRHLPVLDLEVPELTAVAGLEQRESVC